MKNTSITTFVDFLRVIMFYKILSLFLKVKDDVVMSKELYSLLSFSVGYPILTLAILKFLGRFVNMFVMFIPLKIFLLFSGVAQLGFLSDLESSLGRQLYISLLLLFTAFLYFLNVIIQLYTSRLTNNELNRVLEVKYLSRRKKIFQESLIRKVFIPLVNVISSYLMVIVSAIIFLFLSKIYFINFIILFLIYWLFVNYFVFTNNKFNFLKKINLTRPQVLTIISGLFYLVLFFLLFALFIEGGLQITPAILILLLSRLCNSSIKTMFLSLNKASKVYRRVKLLQ